MKREFTAEELIEELVGIGLLTEKEAEAYVYDVIMNESSEEDSISRDIDDTTSKAAKQKLKEAKTTKEVLSKSHQDIDTRIGVLQGGVLSPHQAELYAHDERFNGSASELSEVLDIPTEDIRAGLEDAQDEVEKARETVSFLIKTTGFHIPDSQ